MLSLLFALSLSFTDRAALSLVKSVFVNARAGSIPSGGLVVDLAGVDMNVRDCVIRNLDTLGSAVHLQSGHFMVQDSTFDGIAGRALYYEGENSTYLFVNETEDTLTGTFDKRVIVLSGGGLTCENCIFQDIIGVHVSGRDNNGGAILAAHGSAKLNCTKCQFINLCK